MDTVFCRAQGALQTCVISRDVDRLLRLMKNGVNVNSLNQTGESALYTASYYGELKLVEMLIANGADVNTKNAENNTPLHAAAYNGHMNVMKVLLKSGAIEDQKNDAGYTAMELLGAFIRSASGREKENCLPLNRFLTNKQNTSVDIERIPFIRRLGCYGGVKKDTKVPNKGRKMSRAVYEIIPDDGHGPQFVTTIPVIARTELSDGQNDLPSYESGAFSLTEIKLWHDTAVCIRKVNTKKLAQAALSPKLRSMFEMQNLRELHVVSRLQHPCILSPLAIVSGASRTSEILDPRSVGIVYQRPYLGSLYYFKFIKLEEIPILAALTICRQVAEALQFIHSFRIVHCNLTPRAVHLLAIDSAKLGNFEYAVQLNEIPPTDNSAMLSSDSYSWMGKQSKDSSKTSRSHFADPVSTTTMLSSYIGSHPEEPFRDWYAPELLVRGMPITSTPTTTSQRSPLMVSTSPRSLSEACDVYGLAMLLRSLLPIEKIESPEHTGTRSNFNSPLASPKLVLEAALQRRPEERLPLKQFYRMLIHLFWNEYDTLKPPKPEISTPAPCPLRLCRHKNMTSLRYNCGQHGGTQADEYKSDKKCLFGAHSVLDDDVTSGANRSESKKKLTFEMENQPGVKTLSYMLASAKEKTAPTSVQTPIKNGIHLSSDNDLLKNSKVGKNIHEGRTTSRNNSEAFALLNPSPLLCAFSLREEFNTANESEGVTSEETSHVDEDVYIPLKFPSTLQRATAKVDDNIQETSRSMKPKSRLARFYPFVNEWLKHGKQLSNRDLGRQMDVGSSKPTLGQASAQKITPSLLAPRGFHTILQSPKRQHNKLSRADYIRLAAVPSVPEGVDVPIDLVPWKYPSIASPVLTQPEIHSPRQPSSVASQKTSLLLGISLQDSSTSQGSRSIQTPVKPASHLTQLPEVHFSYAEVTGKPDLIRSSSRLSRRRKHFRCVGSAAESIFTGINKFKRTERSGSSSLLTRSFSCSVLDDFRSRSHWASKIRTTATQTEYSAPIWPISTKMSEDLNGITDTGSDLSLSSSSRMTTPSSASVGPPTSIRCYLGREQRNENLRFRVPKQSSGRTGACSPAGNGIQRYGEKKFTQVSHIVELFEAHSSESESPNAAPNRNADMRNPTCERNWPLSFSATEFEHQAQTSRGSWPSLTGFWKLAMDTRFSPKSSSTSSTLTGESAAQHSTEGTIGRHGVASCVQTGTSSIEEKPLRTPVASVPYRTNAEGDVIPERNSEYSGQNTPTLPDNHYSSSWPSLAMCQGKQGEVFEASCPYMVLTSDGTLQFGTSTSATLKTTSLPTIHPDYGMRSNPVFPDHFGDALLKVERIPEQTQDEDVGCDNCKRSCPTHPENITNSFRSSKASAYHSEPLLPRLLQDQNKHCSQISSLSSPEQKIGKQDEVHSDLTLTIAVGDSLPPPPSLEYLEEQGLYKPQCGEEDEYQCFMRIPLCPLYNKNHPQTVHSHRMNTRKPLAQLQTGESGKPVSLNKAVEFSHLMTTENEDGENSQLLSRPS